MDRDKVEAMLGDAQAELVTQRSVVAYLEQVVTGLQGILKAAPGPTLPTTPVGPAEGAVSVPEETGEGGHRAMSSARVGGYPSTTDAILTVLKSRPNYPMSFKMLWAEMAARDLIDLSIQSGRNAYTNAARRLALKPGTNVIRESDRYMWSTLSGHETASASPAGEERTEAVSTS